MPPKAATPAWDMGFRDPVRSGATRMNGEAVSYVTRHAAPSLRSRSGPHPGPTPMTANERWPPARLRLCPAAHPRTNGTAPSRPLSTPSSRSTSRSFSNARKLASQSVCADSTSAGPPRCARRPRAASGARRVPGGRRSAQPGWSLRVACMARLGSGSEGSGRFWIGQGNGILPYPPPPSITACRSSADALRGWRTRPSSCAVPGR